jgi:hypothetical protein
VQRTAIFVAHRNIYGPVPTLAPQVHRTAIFVAHRNFCRFPPLLAPLLKLQLPAEKENKTFKMPYICIN